MKFCEAMDKLKEGAKVTREPWKEGVYFLMQNEDVKSFQPKLVPYIYNEDIMISGGWLVDDNEEEYSFCNIIPFLQQGSKAKLSDWKEMFIYLDRSTKSLVCHSMDAFPFTPQFSDFVSEDWMVIA
jgi:hypothetical protein